MNQGFFKKVTAERIERQGSGAMSCNQKQTLEALIYQGLADLSQIADAVLDAEMDCGRTDRHHQG